jgi:hypothetical protein
MSDEKPPFVGVPFEVNLTEDEIRKIKAQARDKVLADMRKTEMSRLMDEFEDEARAEAGLAPKVGPDLSAETVDVHIRLPKFSPNIILDGKIYWHNFTYTVTRPVAEYLVYQMQMSKWGEDAKNGEWSYGKAEPVSQPGGIVNTASRLRNVG